MASTASATTRAYTAVIAAGNAVVSKRAYRRGPWPSGVSPSFRAPTPSDVPRLLADARETNDVEVRAARISAASLLRAHEKNERGYASKILTVREHAHVCKSFDQIHPELARLPTGGRSRTSEGAHDRRCWHCAVLSPALNAAAGKLVPFAIVRHSDSAHVIPSFDPDTNIAGAEIKRFQVLVPEEVARRTLALAYPLRWHDAIPALFKESVGVIAQTRSNDDRHPGFAEVEFDGSNARAFEQAWLRAPAPRRGAPRSGKGPRGKIGRLYEDVVWPWNEEITTEIRNILQISHLDNRPHDKVHPVMSFKYALEDCIESDLGVGREPGGLDVDDGYYNGEARHFSEVTSEDLGDLTARDAAHWNAGRIKHVHKFAALPAFHDWVKKLQKEWGRDPWLLTVSAKKQLRFTAPGETPLELWAALTWMAPALVFSFINRAVCQPAHLFD